MNRDLMLQIKAGNGAIKAASEYKIPLPERIVMAFGRILGLAGSR